jgi:hypothetical protein
MIELYLDCELQIQVFTYLRCETSPAPSREVFCVDLKELQEDIVLRVTRRSEVDLHSTYVVPSVLGHIE